VKLTKSPSARPPAISLGLPFIVRKSFRHLQHHLLIRWRMEIPPLSILQMYLFIKILFFLFYLDKV